MNKRNKQKYEDIYNKNKNLKGKLSKNNDKKLLNKIKTNVKQSPNSEDENVCIGTVVTSPTWNNGSEIVSQNAYISDSLQKTNQVNIDTNLYSNDRSNYSEDTFIKTEDEVYNQMLKNDLKNDKILKNMFRDD